MVMTVDGVSYLTRMRPNMHVSTAGKQEPKEAAADVSKPQKNSRYASLDERYMGQDRAAIDNVAPSGPTPRPMAIMFTGR